MATTWSDDFSFVFDAFERNRYFYGKLMTVRDFEQEQRYHNSKRWLLNRHLFGSGVVCGLDVLRIGREPTKLLMTRGVALDPWGREIIVPANTQVDLADLRVVPPAPGATKVIYMFLAYKEATREPVPALKASTCEEVCAYNRILETFHVEVRDAAPAPSERQLCDDWLNLQTVVTDTPKLKVTRTTAKWVGPDEVFAVWVKITAKDNLTNLTVTESLAGGTVVVPDQLTSKRDSLIAGESFLHLYRVKVTAETVSLSGTVTFGGGANPILVPASSVAIAAAGGELTSQEIFAHAAWFTGCPETVAGDQHVALAAITITGVGEDGFAIVAINHLARRFVSNLPLLAELVECLKTHGWATAGLQGLPGPQGVPGLDGTPGVATGVVHFLQAQPQRSVASTSINPGLGPGPIATILGLEQGPTRALFVGASPFAPNFPNFSAPDVLLGTVVDDPQSGQFRVGVRLQSQQATDVRVRWWAFKPSPNNDKGEVIVAGSGGSSIPVEVKPPTVTVNPGRTQQFSANVAVNWKVQEPGGGTIDATGFYTAPQQTGTFQVVATSQADATQSGKATVTVQAVPVVSVMITPRSATVDAGKTQQFRVSVSGATDPTVTWSVQEGTAGGSIDSTGLYTAPSTSGTFHVVATSRQDPGKSDIATVTVTSVSISMQPKNAPVDQGGNLQFRATVTGTSNPAVTWKVQEPGGGTIDPGTGLYTAPNSAGTYHVVATSVTDPTKSDIATVTVPVVSIRVDPPTARLELAPFGAPRSPERVQFAATVMGTTNKDVTWALLEPGSGTLSTTGSITVFAALQAGTFHVVATSVADPTRSARGEVQAVLKEKDKDKDSKEEEKKGKEDLFDKRKEVKDDLKDGKPEKEPKEKESKSEGEKASVLEGPRGFSKEGDIGTPVPQRPSQGGSTLSGGSPAIGQPFIPANLRPEVGRPKDPDA